VEVEKKKKGKGRGEGPPGGPGLLHGQRGHAAHAEGARDALVVSLLATTLARADGKKRQGRVRGSPAADVGEAPAGWWCPGAVQGRARGACMLLDVGAVGDDPLGQVGDVGAGLQ
jgi:hypothetical protein